MGEDVSISSYCPLIRLYLSSALVLDKAFLDDINCRDCVEQSRSRSYDACLSNKRSWATSCNEGTKPVLELSPHKHIDP
jgi:hypothetical protein